jgi:hypothetical protein
MSYLVGYTADLAIAAQTESALQAVFAHLNGSVVSETQGETHDELVFSFPTVNEGAAFVKAATKLGQNVTPIWEREPSVVAHAEVRLVVGRNPKKPGSSTWGRFEAAMAVLPCSKAVLFATGYTKADFAWDLAKGFIAVGA